MLRVAEALFARAGYRGVGLREIAAQVGIRAPSLFKHFPSKKALYNAVLLNIFARLTTSRSGSRATARSPSGCRTFVDGYIDLVASDPHRGAAALSRDDGAPRGDGAGDAQHGVRDLSPHRRLSRATEQRAGQFRDVDRFSFQIALTGAILYHGLAARPYQAALHESLSVPDLGRWKTTLMEIARGGLVAHGAVAPRRKSSTAVRRRASRPR